MDNPLPFNEEGQFVFVADLKEGNRQLNVYAYLFTKAVGCRKYSFKKHGRLPPTTDETMPEPELLKLCGASVACSYYYRREMEGPTISYDEAGGYTMKYDVPRARCGARCGAWDEGDRAESFRRKVKEYFDSESKKLLIENRRTIIIRIKTTLLASKCFNKESITPFAGGGDNVVVAMKPIIGGQNEGDYDESPDPSDEADAQVQGQLKADLYLMTSIILVNSIVDLEKHRQPITRLEEIKRLSS